ncbi:uncharacterized protein HD556DRAFT_1449988 [Suillus plorans]|uniref:Uncharacterized protein n=1 Tax=Suillus plorans TaxID=116603 RepID=A0A9P7DAF5_9AGAM|nr:uncharacterized protein HD556DRAFT_1449988 [Suillus plorans]KAG1786133.1 hypothetical protein HD556DRAFT_1449988 [Suillus plorans]
MALKRGNARARIYIAKRGNAAGSIQSDAASRAVYSLVKGAISHHVRHESLQRSSAFFQYMTKVLMQTQNDEYKSNLILSKGLDFVEEEEQITHQTFKFNPNDLGNEEEYTSVKAKIQKSHLATIRLCIRLRCTVFETYSSLAF